MEHVRTEFGVDSSSRFPFRARTNTVTDATDHPIPPPAWDNNHWGTPPNPNIWTEPNLLLGVLLTTLL